MGDKICYIKFFLYVITYGGKEVKDLEKRGIMQVTIDPQND